VEKFRTSGDYAAAGYGATTFGHVWPGTGETLCSRAAAWLSFVPLGLARCPIPTGQGRARKRGGLQIKSEFTVPTPVDQVWKLLDVNTVQTDRKTLPVGNTPQIDRSRDVHRSV
jgi:hypothetical protein